jgi:hypothetical protein
MALQYNKPEKSPAVGDFPSPKLNEISTAATALPHFRSSYHEIDAFMLVAFRGAEHFPGRDNLGSGCERRTGIHFSPVVQSESVRKLNITTR